MANPLKIESANVLREMTDAELDYAVYRVLTTFASTTTGTGSVQVNPADTTNLTNLGTFTDTVRNEVVGTHPATGAITSNNFVFYQDRTTFSESFDRPVEFTSGAMAEQNDNNLNSTIINRALSNLAAGGIGSYVMQPSAPASGTWTEVATISNTIKKTSGANAVDTNTTKIWKKTNDTAPTVNRPIKKDGTNNFQEMTDAEINSLAARLRNRIVATGIGTYQLATSAPGGGTYVAAGSGFTDTRRVRAAVNYTNTFTGTFSNTFTGFFSNTFSNTFSQNFAQDFAGTYSRYAAYSGAFLGNFTGYYIIILRILYRTFKYIFKHFFKYFFKYFYWNFFRSNNTNYFRKCIHINIMEKNSIIQR